MQRKVATVFGLIIITFFFTSFRNVPVTITRPSQNPLRTIVIDAGHGGKDFGAKGAYSYEKNVTLAVALKLQTTLQQQFPDVKIVMTRTTDIFDAPPIKANKANAAKGDLFICIHCNSAGPVHHSEQIGTTTQTYYTGKGKKRKKHTRSVPKYRYWTTPNPATGTENIYMGSRQER